MGIAAAAQCLHGVAEGVAEVQQPTGAFVPLILRHQRRLAGKAPADDPGPVRLLLLQPGQQLLVSDAAVFDDLGHAAGQLTPGQSGKADGIRQHHAGLVEAAQQVFPLRQIQPRFAAYGAVHLRQQGGGGLHQRHATQQRGRRKARQIAGDAAAQGHDAIAAGQAQLHQSAAQPVVLLQRLGALPRWEGHQRPAGAAGQRSAVQGFHRVVADDGPAAHAQRAQQLLRLLQQAAADVDGVAAPSQRHL